jgi:hypothetical protein
MDDYTKYILLSHLYWIENSIAQDEVLKAYQKIKDEDIFSGVNLNQIQKSMGYEVNYKEIITAPEFEKIIFLWLNLSRVKIDLSFVKFCYNLEEINIGCFNEENLDALKENVRLKKIIANGNKIANIEALYSHDELEFINIENNPCISIKPIAHLKKIKELKVGLIEDEIDALMILKNNPVCEVNYLISGSTTDFDKFNFPFYHIIIKKNETQISFFIEAIEKADKFTQELKFPKELIQLKSFKDKYYAALKNELISRLEIIIGAPVILNLEELIYYQDNYMFEYIHFI